MNIKPLVAPKPAATVGVASGQAIAGGGTRTHRSLWGWLTLAVVGVVAGGAGVTYLAYVRDLRATYAGLAAGSQVIETRHGPLEYATWGEGLPVLVIHGAGGGYDHGLIMARAYGGEGFRWIAPSRFGYLRSPLPADSSTVAQADAFAELLDGLAVERVAILAMSGGVPPALQFARRYPERTTTLVLLSSAPYTPLTAAEQQPPMPVWVYQALFRSNFPFWLLQRMARPRLEELFDVPATLRTQLTAEEVALVDSLVDAFQPVTARFDGIRNEGAAIDPEVEYQVEEITAPTLVIHARNDSINPFSYGEYTAQHIQNAQFLPLTAGDICCWGIRARSKSG
jgi:2-hydroxy-6-oxonona-2,4-dienedioate hydrolase